MYPEKGAVERQIRNRSERLESRAVMGAHCQLVSGERSSVDAGPTTEAVGGRFSRGRCRAERRFGNRTNSLVKALLIQHPSCVNADSTRLAKKPCSVWAENRSANVVERDTSSRRKR